MVDSLKQIAIGSDHAGYALKEHLLKHFVVPGWSLSDFGTHSESSMDYPDAAHPVAKAVQSGQYDFGILICGSGNGVAITANKYTGIRAALCWNEEIAGLARQHNDANILVLPGRFVTAEEGMKITTRFFSTGFEGGRHLRRVEKIDHIL